ncbi:MAG: hypothetical protein KJ955_00120 [Nanoarchaeota archaeon]|nr:hypothetical protein [Nanoarchaeota archaeon]
MCEESGEDAVAGYLLAKIPFLGGIIQKIGEDREQIQAALKTGKEQAEAKKWSFLGLISVSWGKVINALKLKGGKDEKRK